MVDCIVCGYQHIDTDESCTSAALRRTHAKLVGEKVARIEGAREEREAVLRVIYSRSLGSGQVSSPEHPDRPSVPVLLVPVAVLQALGRGERFEAGEHRKEGA